MNPISAHLINDPFDDPGVYLEFRHARQALLFDLGDLRALPPRKILKTAHIFVSHTHMDHFIGFDHLLRICLGRDRRIALFGPPGFIRNIENRLQSYTWNLVDQYTNDFILDVTEVGRDHHLVSARFQCRTGFRREGVISGPLFEGMLLDDEWFMVRAACMDHKIPCLAFCFEEHERVNIKKNILAEMGLPTGAWLNDLKAHILRRTPGDRPIRAWWKDDRNETVERFIPLDVLQNRAVKITAGQRIAYVTDVVFSEKNVEKIAELAAGAEILFIEATFLQEDQDRAKDKYHLTARQAGTIARIAGAKRLIPFHFSPKYRGRAEALIGEAMAAFRGLGSNGRRSGPPPSAPGTPLSIGY
jgi:ribonuclease Z